MAVLPIGCILQDQPRPQKPFSESMPMGIWYYSSYIESTILTKRIYDYSGNCASFAYEITIAPKHPDSCYFKGYHEEMMLPLKRIDNKTFRAGGDSTQYWTLTFLTPSTMTMKEYRSKRDLQKADPASYTFHPKNEAIGDLKKYFIKNILSGVYGDSAREVTLTDDFKVSGLDSIQSYDIELDYWEMGPRMDIIYFKGKDEKSVRYNWNFKNKLLTLKKVREQYKDDEIIYAADSVAYQLKKKK